MKLDPYYNPDSEHCYSSTALQGSIDRPRAEPWVTGVRRVCSTQSEVRVYSNGSERWHYLACPIVNLPPDASADWVRRQTDNVKEGLERIARAKWVDGKAYRKVITELRRAKGLIPSGFTYKRAKQ